MLTLGLVILSIQVKPKIVDIPFTIIPTLDHFHVDLGRLCITTMQAIPSIVHNTMIHQTRFKPLSLHEIFYLAYL